MNYNQLWSGNRGRSRGNRGCGRGRRGGSSMHYRGGPTYHRGVPPLLNTPEPFYNPVRFRGPQENYSHLYPHPLNQESSWPLIRNRPSFPPNPRQSYLPAARVPSQIPNRSSSPLPGTEEYMQKNICEKSAFLKRELELEGPCFNNTLNNFDLSDGEYRTDTANNNFCDNTYQKSEGEGTEDDKPAQVNESVPSPRRNKKRQLSQRVMSVEEIHEKIINHISNLSHGKKINLVNLPGPSGYDIAIQEITRQKRMELSKALRDICNNKFKETEDSSQVINAIIPDFDIKIEELPRELVEQLSSTLNENVTERIHNMCIDPELMFQQAAEMLNNSLDLDKNIDASDVDKVDFNYPSFSSTEGHESMDLGLQNLEDSSLSMVMNEPIGQAGMLNFQNPEDCQSSQLDFDSSQSLNFNMASPMAYMGTQPCPTTYDVNFPENTNIAGNVLEESSLFMNKSNAGMNIYSSAHESSNSSFHEIPQHPNLENINPPFELMNIQDPTDILLSSNPNEVDASHSVPSDLLSEEAELTACLAQTNPDLNLFDISNTSLNSTRGHILNKDPEFPENIGNADEASLLTNESQKPQEQHDDVIDKLITASASKVNENIDIDNSLMQVEATDLGNVLEQEYCCDEKPEDKSELPHQETLVNSPDSLKKKKNEKSIDEVKEKSKSENDQKSKLDLDVTTKKKGKKDKKSNVKSKEESPKKSVDDEHDKRQVDKKSKSKHAEDDIFRKSTEKEELHDRSDKKQAGDKYASPECSKDYTNESDLSERRRQDRRQDERKSKGKYDEDYHRSDKYDRSKYDAYQQPYDDSYRKKYKDSGVDDDKHRRSDHSKNFDKYRELDSDLYHYSKYSDMDEGRKRYYQDKGSSYTSRQDYDYSYHKYDYPPSDYYQRQESLYPLEEYDQKLHYSKSHKNKYKKHAKKHKRHRDHSSGSNASSSGSERNSSNSSSYKTKHIAKPPDLYDSSEEGPTNRHPKTSLKERIQVLCDTKMRSFKTEQLISPKSSEDVKRTPIVDNLINGALTTDIEKGKDLIIKNEEEENVKMDTDENKTIEQVVEKVQKERSDGEEDLKAAIESETLECKKYSQRPWKSPGEKKFMMEHLNQNPTQGEEEDRKIDNDVNTVAVISEESSNKTQNNELLIEHETNCKLSQENSTYLKEIELNIIPITDTDKNQSEPNQTKLQESNILHSAEVSSTSESAIVKAEGGLKDDFPITTQEKLNIAICEAQKKDLSKMLVTTYTQTDPEKDKKNKKEAVKDKSRETHKEKLKSRQNSFTQTIVINATTSTQTHKTPDARKSKAIQTDIIVDSTKEVENVEILDSNISKSLRRKHCVERMFEIDKEIDKLIKQRQAFYNLLNYESDSEKEIEGKPPIPAEHDDTKLKRTHKEKSKNRETKALNVETAKQNQSNSKSNIVKQNSPQKIETEKKALQVPTNSKEKDNNTTPSVQESSKTKKLKRGRPKRIQDKLDASLDNTPELVEDLNKKSHVREETPKPEISTKSKSVSKDRMESSRKRKSKEKIVEEPSKVVSGETNPAKRHKPEPQEPVEKEIKLVLTVSTEEKNVETEVLPNMPKPRKKEKDKKQEVEKKAEEIVQTCDEPSGAKNSLETDVNNEKDVEIAPTTEDKSVSEECKLNGSVVASEDNTPIPVAVETPLIVQPKPFVIPEVTSSAKKKKRRLSGILDYRKKKKKSRNKNKKVVPVIPQNVFSTKSAVNVTRFSLTQLEEMRNEIRNKKAVTAESKLIETKLDDPQIDDSCNSTVATTTPEVKDKSLSDSNVEEGVEESMSTGESITLESQDGVIEFKNFNGAILVIKVIESTVLAASDKGQVLYFNMTDGELVKSIDVSKLAVTSLVVAKVNEDNLVYAGSLDSRLSVINFNLKTIVKQDTLSEPIQCMESSWRFIFIGSDRGSITRYDLNLDKVVDSLKVSSCNILMMRASQEGPRKVLIVAMRNSPVCVRDAISGLLLRTMQTSFSPTVYTLLIDKNLIYCGTSQHDILVYTFEDGQLVFQHEATKSKGVVCMQIIGNLLLAGCYNGNIYIYNTNTNVYLGTINGPGGLMLSMEIVDDKVIVGTKSGNFKAWKIPQQFLEQM